MDFLDLLWDAAKFIPGVGAAAGLVDTATDAAGDVIDWLWGDDDAAPTPAGTPGGGGLQLPPGAQIPGVPGGGFGVPQQPGGGLVGPVYATQGIPAQIAPVVAQIVAALAANPQMAKFVQRRFDFARGRKSEPRSQALWAALARQLPKSSREALEQFLVGFPAPIGLSKPAQDAFLLLQIAESGYSPEQLCCVST